MPDHDIDVNYYVVQEGSALAWAITGYLEKCAKFVNRVEGLVKKYQADSAIRLHDGFNIRVSGLNFTDRNAPLLWNMNDFGHFAPGWTSKAAKDLDIRLPYFRDHYRQAPEGIRFGKLGDAIIISVTPNKDGSVSQVADADLIDADTLERLKQDASPEDNEYIAQLARFYWVPAPLARTKAFTPSPEVRRLNGERLNFSGNWMFALKHSPTGRALRRVFTI
ncbi:MAG: hypothetical protein H6865_04845 [Rhodospirillales bacterium]|nr:hypothetical protein [Alphaproteobacteria bacterium]MCB9986945.1 hypothetical protein [Rhodospirillales bacterium]USO08280.1 MAG: hypothetical protein H6866_03445 [Rhodospirillales bacterium]